MKHLKYFKEHNEQCEICDGYTYYDCPECKGEGCSKCDEGGVIDCEKCLTSYEYHIEYDLMEYSSDPVLEYTFNGDEYETALQYFNDFDSVIDGYPNSTHVKTLYKVTLMDGEITDKEEIETDTYIPNESSDELLDDIQMWFKNKFNTNHYKYQRIEHKDKIIQFRFSDHTENIHNIDRFDKVDYHVSVVITNVDLTKNRFVMTNSFERKSNEYELRFDSNDSLEDIKEEILGLLEEIKDNI